MRENFDQTRAAFAWGCAVAAADPKHGQDYRRLYKNLAKGAPALIMNSGLMPTLAFYRSKTKEPATQQLGEDLMRGLGSRLPKVGAQEGFASFMQMLQKCESHEYLRYTDEAIELLKWIRQFVDAVDAAPAGRRA